MGIFSQNTKSNLGFATVEAAAGYGGVDAGAKIQFENYQNDMALFTAIIESDFASAKMEKEGAVNEASVITEGTVGNIFKKIAEMFKKLWEKLKGMIQSFMVKFVAVFVKDNKELVKKYHKQMVKNLADSKKKYDEFEYKMTEGYYKYLNGESEVTKLNFTAMQSNYSADSIGNKEYDKAKEDAEKKIINHINSQLKINISEISELKKELDEKYIGSKETYEGYTSALNATVESELTNGRQTLKTAETKKKNIEKECKEQVTNAERAQKDADKEVDDPKVRQVMNEAANLAYYNATTMQSVMTTVCTWELSFLKSALKEIRALYIKAVSRRSSVKEDAELLYDVIDEAVDYDVESMFEADVEADLNDDDLSAEIDSIEELPKDECSK